MNCDIIKDLIPLYIDGCCSEKSTKAVDEHLKGCPECERLLKVMKEPTDIIITRPAPESLNKISSLKASVLQSVLLFISFGLIILGVAAEASTDYDSLGNNLFALNFVVPATGFMLSLANWYFVRSYKNRKAFSVSSFFITLVITVFAYIWTLSHYDIRLRDLFSGVDFYSIPDWLYSFMFFYGGGIILTAVFLILSGLLSYKYASLSGKN